MIKRLQKLFGGLAQAVYNIATNEEIGIGFKTYEEMLFNSPTSISPFNDAQWNLIMQWYKIFAYISGSLILIAVVIISYKMIISSINTIQRNVIRTQHQTTNEKITKSDSQTQIASRMSDNGSLKSVGSKIVNAAYQGSKTYLRVGAQMAEGDFSKNKQIQNKNDNNNTYITQKNIDDLKTEKLGDVDEK